MTILTRLAAFVTSIAIIYLLYMFAILSRKLGAVTKMKPYYRWLYVALILVIASLACRWIVLSVQTVPEAASGLILSEWFSLLGYTLPLAIAAVLALVVVLRYWGWLFREQDR